MILIAKETERVQAELKRLKIGPKTDQETEKELPPELNGPAAAED